MGRIDHLIEASQNVHSQNIEATGALAKEANETAKLNMNLKAKQEQTKNYLIAGVVIVIAIVFVITQKKKK